jgi:DNA polymerase III subunit delta'
MITLGHEKIIRNLERLVENNNLAHAYLFSGPESVGKFRVAFEFANKLIRDEKKSINPDVLVLRPEIEEKKGILRKKDITIEAIRNLEHGLSLSSFFGGHKVAIIDDADCLTRSAQNALLKTLEEPPERAIIILVVQNKEKIIPTMISRCQEIKFNLVSEKEIRKMIPQNNPQAEQIIFWSMNRPGLAREFINNPEAILDREKDLEFFKSFFSLNINEQFAIAENISKDIKKLEKKLQIWTVILRKESHFSKFFMIEKIEESLKNIRETNANPRLVMEKLFLDLVSLRC